MTPPPDTGLATRTGAPGPSRGTRGRPGRPRHRVIWSVLAALTALAVVVPAGVQVWGILMRHTQTRDQSYSRPIAALDVSAGSGAVTISSGPAGRVVIRQRLTWTDRKPRVRQAWDGR